MLCSKCGAQIPDGAVFCPECGSAVSAADEAFRQSPRGRVGFSDEFESPEIVAALAKNNRITRITCAALVIVPLIGFLIWGAVTEKMETAVPAGLIVSLIILIISLIVLLKKKLDKPFEGTVTDKKIKSSIQKRGRHYRSVPNYILYITTDEQKKKKKKVSGTVFEYLHTGDRVKYHPEFPQPFEKYDKSGDTEILCMFCGALSPLGNDKCRLCKNPLVH